MNEHQISHNYYSVFYTRAHIMQLHCTHGTFPFVCMQSCGTSGVLFSGRGNGAIIGNIISLCYIAGLELELGSLPLVQVCTGNLNILSHTTFRIIPYISLHYT